MALGEDQRHVVRAVFRTAVTWGIGWVGMAFLVFLMLRTLGFIPARLTLLDGFGMSIRFGFVGGIAGGAFSAFIRLVYRGRRISELRWVRFGLAGGIVTSLFVTLILESASVLTGGGFIPLNLINTDTLWTGVFGAVAAGGSLKLAQVARTALPAEGRGQVGAREPVDQDVVRSGEQEWVG